MPDLSIEAAKLLRDRQGKVPTAKNALDSVHEPLRLQAVEWLSHCRNPRGLEWIFCGRWLMLDRADDARTLAEMPRLVAAIEDTFAALFPVWLATYERPS